MKVMTRYASPSALMDCGEAVSYLQSAYQVDEGDAEHLLASAVRSDSGMAPFPREGKRTLWATHMTTQDGKFIIETEW